MFLNKSKNLKIVLSELQKSCKLLILLSSSLVHMLHAVNRRCLIFTFQKLSYSSTWVQWLKVLLPSRDTTHKPCCSLHLIILSCSLIFSSLSWYCSMFYHEVFIIHCTIKWDIFSLTGSICFCAREEIDW